MMKTKFIPAIAVLLGALTVAGFSTLAVAKDAFPSKTIRLIVPYSPGGTSDILGRLMAGEMSARLGQSVVVENVPGASSSIGTGRVAGAPNDGYTILLATTTALTSNPFLYKKLPYKVEDFDPITVVATQPFVFGANPKLPANNLAELIAYAKKNPGKIDYGTTGVGSSAHVVGEMAEAGLGIDMIDVPYKGSAPALTDLVGGQIDIYFDGITTTLPFYRAGTLKVLAVTSEKRVSTAPDIPTVVEQGHPELVVYNRYYLLAPAGTPRPVIDRLNKAATEALKSEAVRARLDTDGNIPHPSTPQEMAEILKSDAEVWGRTIRKLGIQLG